MAVEINNNGATLQKQLEDAIQNTIQKAIENLFEKGVLDRKRHGKIFKEIRRPVCIRNDDGTNLEEKRLEFKIHHEMKMRHHFRNGHHHHKHHHFHHMHHHGPRGRFIHHFKGKHGKFGKNDKLERFLFLECASRAQNNIPAIEDTPTNRNVAIENATQPQPEHQIASVDKVSKDLQKLQFDDNITIIENEWQLLD